MEATIYGSSHTSSFKSSQSFLKGLSELRYISLVFLNITEKSNVQQVLPYNHLPIQTLGTFIVQCIQEDKKGFARSRTYCSNKEVSLNTTDLRRHYLHLQTLSFNGVHLVDERVQLQFPWDSLSMDLPLNMSHSKYRQRLVRDGHSLHSGSQQIIRSLVVNVSTPVVIENICPYERQLNTVVLEGIDLRYIPLKCFTPEKSNQTKLFFLELFENPLHHIINGTFSGLTKLESLHLRYCKLQELKVGIFDNLVNLKLLNLDFNQLKVLQSGVFSKLVSLENLFLHYNDLYHVDYHSLPIFSRNLIFVDFKNNKLESFPYDCLTLPNLGLCDCDNNSISIHNLKEVISYFDPVEMYFVQPLAYYGESYNPTDVAIMHETDQAEINLRNNEVKSVLFNNNWSM